MKEGGALGFGSRSPALPTSGVCLVRVTDGWRDEGLWPQVCGCQRGAAHSTPLLSPPRRGSPRGAGPGCGAELGLDWLGAAPPGAGAFAPAPGEEL